MKTSRFWALNTRRLLWLCGLLALSACAHQGQPVAVPAAPIIRCPDANQILLLLSQTREIQALSLAGRESCGSARLLTLLQQAQTAESRADVQKLQAQLESLLAKTDNLDPASQGLARLPLQQLQERRKLAEALERQQAQNRDLQKRYDDLNGKLNALREVERELQLKPSKTKGGQP
ncbi:hypothetical protein [Chromobacterium rhizoryzae]|uniref:hypothetical protein n=1 Tax=Chromobacterium rhizoryzae TaxID=1778675 RepID=UPI001D07647D|nr:hypothetical protein [Chromobacterium rhizoryzae]